MSIFNFNKETEKEVSSGVLIGYVLVGFAIVLVLAFIVFAVVKKVSNNSDSTNQTVIEQSVETETDSAPAE